MSVSDEQFRFLLRGHYAEGNIRTRWVESTRRQVPEIEAAIEHTWQELLSRPGVRLFDGPVCRFEAAHAERDRLLIDLSPTSYRIVCGTNFSNPQFATTYGPDVMANPVGVSTLLHTTDEFLVLGRRNRSVAYYPERVHPFAGSMEVRPIVDPFENVRRELHEELALGAAMIASITCLGLAEDSALAHPEFVFVTRTRLTRSQVDAQLDHEEHSATWAAPANAVAARDAAEHDPVLTPVSRAALIAWAESSFKP